ncbi:choline transporter-like protein 2 [Trichogramma pretiosum]|uniref:choline transporter-like protein 2 n=1 Tax=Trichogramma pretiosum TaxID=7493 RepID=UPI000C71B1DA|nr:choline transporter-like protein 2 [Trichogramma pretiosum]
MIFCLLSLSVVCLVNFYHGFVGMACKIIQETIKAIMFFPSLTLCSLLLYMLILVTTVLGVVVGSYLERMLPNLQSPFDHVCNQLGNAFGCLWLTSFFFSFFRVVISGTYGTWYWTRNKQEVPKFTPMRFIWITLRYHIGSVITGSLITPIGNLIQVFGVSHLNFADPSEINHSTFTKILQSIYNSIGMINDQALVYTALRGQEFGVSAKTAFNIWRRNHTKFAAIDQLTRAIIFMGYVSIACLSLTFYLVAKVMTCGNQSILFMGFVALSIFMLINSIILLMDVAMDTVLICALEDFEVNSNSARPYYMSDKLKEMILESRME